jgi:hypothetical protein
VLAPEDVLRVATACHGRDLAPANKQRVPECLLSTARLPSRALPALAAPYRLRGQVCAVWQVATSVSPRHCLHLDVLLLDEGSGPSETSYWSLSYGNVQFAA